MEQRRNHHNGSGGFMLGVIVGVLITLLFTTKKGREILRELTDKGISKFSELEDRLRDEGRDDKFDTFVNDEEDENDYVKPDQPTRHLAEAQSKEEKKEVHTEHKAPAPKTEEEPKHHANVIHHESKNHDTTRHEEKEEGSKKSPARRFFKLKK